jgi:hypothetical protein
VGSRGGGGGEEGGGGGGGDKADVSSAGTVSASFFGVMHKE